MSWPEYVEALGVLSRAQAAARARESRIEAGLAQLEQSADEALRSAVARRDELERRLGELEQRLAELGVPPDGPVHSVPFAPPASCPDALATLERFENQLQEYVDGLTQARRAAPSRPALVPGRRWPAVLVVVVLLAAVLVTLALVV